MIHYSFQHITNIINGRILQEADNGNIEHLVIDSRKIIFPSSSIFFALAGPRRDGHHFIEEVYQKGVRNFVIGKSIDITNWKDANFVLVSEVLKAMQELVAHRP